MAFVKCPYVLHLHNLVYIHAVTVPLPPGPVALIEALPIPTNLLALAMEFTLYVVANVGATIAIYSLAVPMRLSILVHPDEFALVIKMLMIPD